MDKTQLYQWPDKMLFIGPLGEVGAHRHGANAWCLGLDGELGFAAGREAQWRRGGAARIVMNHEHRLHGGGRPVAVLYLHPEYDDWRAAAADAPGGARLGAAAPALAQLLNDAYRSGAVALPALGEALDRLLYGARPRGVAAASAPVDAAVRRLKGALEHNLPLSALAQAAQLSPDRLNHRFSAELGLAPRRFRGWHRVVHALDLALRGSSLTGAALDAGFASPAHLSSAFHSTFGLAPSTVLRAPRLEFHAAE